MHGRRPAPDYTILMTVIVILVLGLFMVFSASYYEAAQDYGDPYYYLKRQLVWSVIGLSGMVVAMNLDYRRLRPWAGAVLLGAVILLVLVAIPGIGVVSHGSRRWLGFGPLQFQPSEAAKPALVLFLAAWLSGGRQRPRAVIPFMGLLGLVCGLVMLQPDLGTAVALAGTGVAMLFLAGCPFSRLAALAAAGVPVLFALIFSSGYRRQRFLSFLDPWQDPLRSGYHIIQGLYALGSGGLFGVGFTQSRQKFFYLPERHTDFIFAILGEELGLVGTLAVLALFAFLAWRGYRVALTAPDAFGALLAGGITAMIALQAIVNIGVVTATLPITGITLPFVSFGGSSLVFSLAGVGLLLSVSRQAR